EKGEQEKKKKKKENLQKKEAAEDLSANVSVGKTQSFLDRPYDQQIFFSPRITPAPAPPLSPQARISSCDDTRASTCAFPASTSMHLACASFSGSRQPKRRHDAAEGFSLPPWSYRFLSEGGAFGARSA